MSNTSKTKFIINVRALADFCLQEGHLNSSTRPSPSALEGQHSHRITQQKRGDNYKSEVSLSFQWLCKELEITVRGRADGIEDNCVEEIKSTRIPPEEINSVARQQNLMQAKIYGAMHALRHPHYETIEIRLTYVHPQTLQQWSDSTPIPREELVDFLVQCSSIYEQWLAALVAHRLARNDFLQQLSFPFLTMRQGQREMAESVYKACMTGTNLTVEAPTGTGKTLAALFPALKSMLKADIQTLFFLTMKTTGQVAAFDALTKLDSDQRLNVVSLTARTRLCLSKETPCDGEYCEYAQDYFKKRAQHREQLFTRAHWTIDALKEFGSDKKICPYYLSQDWAIWADLVIGDINYIYDTTAVQPLLLKEIDNKATILIDESHNLIDRGRMIFSTGFAGSELQTLMRLCPKSIEKNLKKIQASLRSSCKNNEGLLSFESPDKLCQFLRDFISHSPALLRENPSFEPPLIWQEFIFNCARFVRLHELASAGDFAWRYTDGKPSERCIELLCLNPAELLRSKHNLVNNIVAFSATLKPWQYSNQLNGLADAVIQELPSPFKAQQYQVYLASDVSTRYNNRQFLPDQLRTTLQACIHHPKNTIIFFSSYAQLRACLKPLEVDDRVLIQEPNWDQQKRDEILNQFRHRHGITLFTVLGGVFAEGIDLPGSQLEQVVVVGPGLPQVNDVNNAVRDRLERQALPGFDFAYVFPGLQKVLQAAGRCIRTEQDHGDILLIDDRFVEYLQRQWLPNYWTINSGPLVQWQPQI